MAEKYTIGVDFGTLSGRAVLCRVSDGAVLFEKEVPYAHGTFTECLPDGTPVPVGSALQDPEDYINSLIGSVSYVADEGAKAGIAANQIAGLGIDITCSVVAVEKDGMPVVMTHPEFRNHPQAYLKLWKHHGAEEESVALTNLLAEKDPEMLARYGGKVTSESFMPKVLETYRRDREVYDATDRFLDLGDWLCQLMTGTENRSLPLLCFKALYRPETGFSQCVLDAFPCLKEAVGTKLRGPIVRLCETFGCLTPEMAEKMHLCAGIPIATPGYDGHWASPATGVKDETSAALSLGTSSALIVFSRKKQDVRGVCSMAWEGILPGLYAYAMGQTGFGDSLAWVMRTLMPASVQQEADGRGISIHQLMTEKAAMLLPGESGLLFLDWFNGAKPMGDMSLSGLMLGMTLQTRPEEIYLAALECLAFGVRSMLDECNKAGICPRRMYLAGGIAYKNPFFVQLICDITGLELIGTDPLPTPAVGSAMHGAVVAGLYDTLGDATDAMNCANDVRYTPNAQRHDAYEPLYREYITLRDEFAANGIMHRLRDGKIKK